MLTYEQIFILVQSGEMTLEQFQDWADNLDKLAYDSGHAAGFNTGYDIAQSYCKY